MYQSQDKRAWNRGVHLAGIWKRVISNLLKLDKKCVVWAKAHRLKSWMGHIPLILTIICLLVALITGGLIVSGSVVLLWSLIALVTQSVSSREDSSKNIFSENNQVYSQKPTTEYRTHGDAGSGWYASGIKLEDDD
ncbi:hypothetical protein GZZ45_08540 [Klebsiella aerogenes]|uniref:hypothetical protein n=1 Tax=Klebsiella aerogenes TaxID=548 RepID=UPI00190309BB|nr:hypothetical protein [Klebsiella aerogenes]MBK0488238.1 hypothetical protein [Klebsiella aerogenes]